MEEKVWSRHGGRENSAAMWSARELAPLHLSWYKHYFFFFFLFQQRIRESLTGAADGRGSHRLQKYPEVYTSQTRSQIGIRTEALLWRGKGSILKYILLTFNLLLIFLPPGGVNTRWVTAAMSTATENSSGACQTQHCPVWRALRHDRTGARHARVSTEAYVVFPVAAVWKHRWCAIAPYLSIPRYFIYPFLFLFFFQGQTNFMIARSQ